MKRFELIGLKCPAEISPPFLGFTVIDLIQWIVFCSTNNPRSASMISCGSMGLEGAAPTFRKNEPPGLSTRFTSAAHATDHSRYFSRATSSEYFE